MFAACLVSVQLFAAAPPKVLETTDVSGETRLALAIPEGSKLELKGVFGEVEVLPAAGEESIIEIARQSAVSEPQLVLLRHENGYTLCAVHPSPNPKKPNECVPGKKGRMFEGNRKEWPRVNFTISVPEGIDVMTLLAGGRIAARTGINNLDLEMQWGDIFVHDEGSLSIDARTGGNINAVLSDRSWLPKTRGVRFYSLGGNIDVTVPKTLPIHYWIYSDQPVRSAFKLAAKESGLQQGTAGPPSETEMHIRLESVLLGKITIRHP